MFLKWGYGVISICKNSLPLTKSAVSSNKPIITAARAKLFIYIFVTREWRTSLAGDFKRVYRVLRHNFDAHTRPGISFYVTNAFLTGQCELSMKKNIYTIFLVKVFEANRYYSLINYHDLVFQSTFEHHPCNMFIAICADMFVVSHYIGWRKSHWTVHV